MNATANTVRVFQVFYKNGQRVTVKSINENVRDIWTGEIGTSVRFQLDDEQHGTSFCTLPLDLFLAAWTR